MQFRTYPLIRDGAAHIGLIWERGWRNLQVSVQGQSLDPINDPDMLRKGASYMLADQHELSLKVTLWRLDVRLDGRPLPGSAFDPYILLLIARWLLVFITVYIFISALSLGWRLGQQDTLMATILQFIEGMAFATLTYHVWQNSRLALWLAMGLYVVDGIAGVALLPHDANIQVSGIIYVHLILLVIMFLGFKGIDILEQEQVSWLYKSPKLVNSKPLADNDNS